MGNNSRPETIVIINCALNAPLMLISIIGNTLVLAAILRTPSLRSPSFILLFSLAFSDLLVGLVVQPLYITYELTKHGSLYNVMTTMAFAACGVSLSTITAISVDRFLALHYHMRYPNLMTKKRAMVTSATLWLMSFILSFLAFWNMNAYYFTIAVCIVIFLLISSVCYLKIFRIVRRHQLQIHAQQHAVENLNAENNQSMQKSAINTFIYYTVMILCYTPVFIAMSILVISPHHWTVAWNFTDTVAFMNSSINPFLYCWRLRELRTAVVKTVRQMSWKQTEGTVAN
ncbi:melanocyte-stimulating hormone receptor-like [Oculina patagonica]